jgi:predicted dienelactone hydrolase
VRAGFRSSPVRRSFLALALALALALVLVAVCVLVVVLVAVGSRTEPRRMPDRFVAMELPASPVGRQMRWLIAASARLPLSEGEWRGHLSAELLALPGASPADLNEYLQMRIDAKAVRLLGLSVVQPDALVAIVRVRDAREFVVMLTVDRAGMINNLSLEPAASGPVMTLPAPTGPSAVGTDAVALADPARGGRRVMVTLWYPAASTRGGSLAAYASPRLAVTLGGLPPVRVHARYRAPARRARLPVVLFSPGRGAPRVFYQALAEDLASHGYLVIAVDHTGEAPVEFPNGDIQLPPTDLHPSLAALSTTRLADMRLVLHRLILQRPSGISTGPRPDSGRIAVVGHSLGGSTAAGVMRAEPRVRVGVDIDGPILGSASRRGVTRPFMVMTGRTGLEPTARAMLTHSSGPRLVLRFVDLEHMSFSDLPAIAPTALSPGAPRSVRAIAVERAYLQAFLDRYMLGRRSPLLTGPSPRWPHVSVQYRRQCCA